MALAPGERSILAYFPTGEKAQQTVDGLKKIGINQVQIDRVSLLPDQLNLWESGYINGLDEALELMEKAEVSSYKKGKHKWKNR